MGLNLQTAGHPTTTEGIPEVDWERLLLVYMRNPTDKTLDLRDCDLRAVRYASIALGRDVSVSEHQSIASVADKIVNATGYFPFPSQGLGRELADPPRAGCIPYNHPFAPAPLSTKQLSVDEAAMKRIILEIVEALPSARSRFLALWRLLPERLASDLGEDLRRLPADLRMPGHTLTHHADTLCGLWSSRSTDHGGAYLSFSLGPVQRFISAARSVRDLWSGSAILSWLTFQGLSPILQTLGPTALVFPTLRANPLMDLWLRQEPGLAGIIAEPSKDVRLSPSIPNRFVALVPWGRNGEEARTLARACEVAAHDAWGKLAEDVRDRLQRSFAPLDTEWDKRWSGQVEQFFEVVTTVVPERDLADNRIAKLLGGSDDFETVWPDAGAVRGLTNAIPEGDRPVGPPDPTGRWQAQMEFVARAMEARRTARHIPASEIEIPSPPKCSLLGSFEQMGPDSLEASRRFWENAAETSVDGVRLRRGERFSAIALCKRFAAPATLAGAFQLSYADLRFPDTQTVAASEWLTEAGIDPDAVRRESGSWNGRWLDPDGGVGGDDEPPPPAELQDRIVAARRENPVPKYYAVVLLDADNMGLWLQGEQAPKVRDILHPETLTYYEGLGPATRRGLEARRPVSAALHASISDALNGFACQVAGPIVKRHSGTLIYSGGDDVMALLPARRAVACADALQKAFRGLSDDDDTCPVGWHSVDGRQLLMMGPEASMSAGIAYVHVREDLRLALEAARKSEQDAKQSGRNAMALQFMRRSGEHAGGVIAWELASWFQNLVDAFASGATNIWVYRLRTELPTLSGPGIQPEAIAAELMRLANRASEGEGARAAGISGATVAGWWRDFVEVGTRRGAAPGILLEEFTKICQGAAFVARGQDD